MSTAIRERQAAGLPDRDALGPVTSEGLAWPRTSRVLTWAIALFAALLWLVPVEDVELPVPLPVDPTVDRFVIGGTVVLWVLARVTRRTAGPSRRTGAIGAALGIWLSASLLSVLLNVVELARYGEVADGLRGLSVAASFGALFLVVSTTLQPVEVRRLLRLQVVLASLTAVGVVIEFRTGTNLFYRAAELVPGLRVGSPPTVDATSGRADITGPTGHGLAVCTILAMTVPLAAAAAVQATRLRGRLFYGLLVCLLVAGCVATQRKTGAIVPAVALLAFFAYRPKAALQFAPLAVVLVVIVQVAAPGALSGLRYQFVIAGDTGSTTGRTEDYAAVQPDVVSHLLTGRGFGTFDPLVYRFLDNQALGLLISTGVLGVLAYLAVLVVGGRAGHRLARDPRGSDRLLGAAIVAAVVAYGVSNLLFDTLAFRNVPYLLMFYLGYAVVLSRPGDGHAEADDGRPGVTGAVAPPGRVAARA